MASMLQIIFEKLIFWMAWIIIPLVMKLFQPSADFYSVAQKIIARKTAPDKVSGNHLDCSCLQFGSDFGGLFTFGIRIGLS